MSLRNLHIWGGSVFLHLPRTVLMSVALSTDHQLMYTSQLLSCDKARETPLLFTVFQSVLLMAINA